MRQASILRIVGFQFISTKVETDATINIPWKSNNTLIGQTNGKSDIEQRIAQIRQEQSLQAPSPCNTLTNASKQKSTKISNICKKFLADSSTKNENISEVDSHINTNNEEVVISDNDDDIIIEQSNNTRKRRATRTTTNKKQKTN